MGKGILAPENQLGAKLGINNEIERFVTGDDYYSSGDYNKKEEVQKAPTQEYKEYNPLTGQETKKKKSSLLRTKSKGETQLTNKQSLLGNNG